MWGFLIFKVEDLWKEPEHSNLGLQWLNPTERCCLPVLSASRLVYFLLMLFCEIEDSVPIHEICERSQGEQPCWFENLLSREFMLPHESLVGRDLSQWLVNYFYAVSPMSPSVEFYLNLIVDEAPCRYAYSIPCVQFHGSVRLFESLRLVKN